MVERGYQRSVESQVVDGSKVCGGCSVSNVFVAHCPVDPYTTDVMPTGGFICSSLGHGNANQSGNGNGTHRILSETKSTSFLAPTKKAQIWSDFDFPEGRKQRSQQSQCVSWKDGTFRSLLCTVKVFPWLWKHCLKISTCMSTLEIETYEAPDPKITSPEVPLLWVYRRAPGVFRIEQQQQVG